MKGLKKRGQLDISVIGHEVGSILDAYNVFYLNFDGLIIHSVSENDITVFKVENGKNNIVVVDSAQEEGNKFRIVLEDDLEGEFYYIVLFHSSFKSISDGAVTSSYQFYLEDDWAL